MINRRTFVKLSAGSMAATIALPALASEEAAAKSLKTLVVYHESSVEGLAFFEEVLARGAEAFPIIGELKPADKQKFFRRLAEQPAMVIGLTNQQAAFELQMAAGDAFHFKVRDERFKVDQGGDGSLVAWAVAPIEEIHEEEGKKT